MIGSISVIVVNWNAGDQLRTCINSIVEHAVGLVKQTIVVDNGSVDDSAACIDDLSDISLIRAEANLGFSKACNLGAQHATSDFLLFLNPDAALFPDTLSRALTYMRDPVNAAVGICGVQLLDRFGKVARSCARFPSALGLIAHAVGVDRAFPFLGNSMAEWNHAHTREVDQVIGAFFLVRRELFEALQGFDERFFVYFEEVDFSYRAHKAGWRSVYLADVQAFHAGGGTSDQVKGRRLFYSWRSRLLYSFKHLSWLGASAVLLTTLFVEPLSRSALALLLRSGVGLKATWDAYVMLWRWLPLWLSRGATR